MWTMDERAQKLRRAVTKYRHELERARKIRETASKDLGDAVRNAYAEGMKKADILRGIDHEWSRTWVDKALKGEKTGGS